MITNEQIQIALKSILESIHKTDTFKLAVCVPSQDIWKTDFGICLFAMGVQFGAKKVDLPWVKRHEIMLFNRKSSLIHSLRHSLVVDAIEWGATHILFVDSDQTFPADTIHKLAAHDKLVVGANIVTKSFPAKFCATGLDGNRVQTKIDSEGIEEVKVCGTGLVLINTKALLNVSLPYFLMPYDHETRTFMGEDVYFSNILREAGVPIYIDHELSKVVGHIGSMEYGFSHAGEVDEETGEVTMCSEG